MKQKFKLNDELFHIGKIRQWNEMISIHIIEIYPRRDKFGCKHKLEYKYYDEMNFGEIITKDMNVTVDFLNENFLIKNKTTKLLFKK